VTSPFAVTWTPHQQRAIDCIACQRGLPVRRVYLDRALPPPRLPRFNSRRLAAKLARALRKETP